VSHLVLLRKQIKSIQTTRKITHAVRLVSMSLYAKLEKLHAPLKYYLNNTEGLFIELIRLVPEWKNALFFPDDVLDTKPLIIIVSTTKGLCGSLNFNLFHFFQQSFLVGEHQVPHFVTIGQKATKYVKEEGIGDIVCSYNELNSNNYISIANDLVSRVLTRENTFSSVVFYSNFLKNFFIQKPYKTVLIPLSINDKSKQAQSENGKVVQPLDLCQFKRGEEQEIVWEQDKHEMLDALSMSYLRSVVMNILFQSLLAEQSARFLAMDSSTSNADKFLDRLILQFNKQRQAVITKEISELSASNPS
jgi:F-type H+-transporting ATPase subunit gamma